ncbi:MAG: type II toxin-antitoxin system HicB family antitoxin [Candidatus Omnitrophica bacterium]|nr:type II toxin-antitoxin system HicB family antitoxin [Candidatus Omnitrophota bacterium]
MDFNKKQFKIIIEQDEDGYFVGSVPSLPGCHTQAKDLKTLRTRIKEAISLCLEVAQEDKEYLSMINDFASEPVFIGMETIEA